MSPDVQILPQTLINQIAAGEVIVRPASVVKELVENAFDAEARRIRVEMSRDSRDLSISDDGGGMTEENAKRALMRSSTSKIRDFTDLERLITRGFRGEALASIIAISRFEMLTRPHDAVAGTRIVAEGGKILSVEPVGCAAGTTFHVRELFYNTPARLKFLKSAGAEFQAAVQILTQQALSQPGIGLTCVRDGDVRFDLPPGQDLKARIEDLLGAEVQGQLIPVDYEREGLSVRGFACRPKASRKDRRWQFLMVNGRPIGAKQLTFPIQEAYSGLLMKQRFPVVVLDIGIEPTEVDVNVHPTKEEVRFEQERKVGGLLHRAVQEALHAANLMPSLETAETPREEPLSTANTRPASAPQPPARDPASDFLFNPKGIRPFTNNAPSSAGSARDMFGAKTPAPAAPSPSPATPHSTAHPPPEPERTLEPPVREGLRLGEDPEPLALGQIADTYVVAQWGEDLLLIDQHAAHERLLYQRICDEAKQPPRQPLMVPIPLQVAAAERAALEMVIPLLAMMGLDIEEHEPGRFAVSAVPSDLETLDPAALVRDLIDEAESGERAGGTEALRDKVRTRMACRAAIKAGKRLHPDEMKALIRDIAAARLSFTCPHGRPTMVVLRKGQLDRQFGRIVS